MDDDTARMIRANEANWDARTPIHLASDFYSVPTRDPADWFADYEWTDLGDLAGKHVAHLQCHLGTETLAFAQRGAIATGLDFSEQSVQAAQSIAQARQLDVTYLKSDVYEATQALGANKFDIVYTGKGAICFLPDLTRWAQQIHGLLRPGGLLYLVDFHPLLNSLSPIPTGTDDLDLRHDYLEGRGHTHADGTFTYTDGPPLTTATDFYEWRHSIAEVVTALIAAGLKITILRESADLPWQRWPSMTTDDGVWHRLPPESPRIPLLFAVAAEKPVN